MDPRSAAHVLNQIAELQELHGTDRFRTRAYRGAARALLALRTDDIRPLIKSGELASTRGIGPATLSILTELANTGRSEFLERLRQKGDESLIQMMRVPGLGLSRIRQIRDGLGIQSVEELELAASDGRLAALKGFGPRTADKIARGIAHLKATGGAILYAHAMEEAERLLAAVREHPGVSKADIAGSLRRRCETARDVDIVAACPADPARVAAAFAQAPAVSSVATTSGGGRGVSLVLVDGVRFDLYCETPDRFAMALLRATGSRDHVAAVHASLTRRGYAVDGGRLVDSKGREQSVSNEAAIYSAAGLGYVEPELREAWGELDAAREGTLPRLIELEDVKGALHCHSSYSDGLASVEEMARAAKARGWAYLGMTDHSQSAFYAGGMTRDRVERQLEEIDELNARSHDVRVLKGIEADILADGRVDYDEDILSRFDYVIGSVHSRFAMDEAAMTTRVLRALDDPHLTILGHPTGRLLLTREGYSIDMAAVIEKAAETGAAIELNADPQRLDIDWRTCRAAREHGVTVEIGPDAHSTRGLDNVAIGVGIARKGWLEPGNVLNTRDAEGVLEFARQRRSGAGRGGR